MPIPTRLPALSRRATSLLILALVAWTGCDTGGAAGHGEEILVATPLTATFTDVLLQAIAPVSPDVVWVSGHGGTWARTEDGGATWVHSVVHGYADLQFRDIAAMDAGTAVLLSSGTGPLSRIFRTEDGGVSWDETFVMDHPEGFLDCMDFVDGTLGFAYGDEVDGALYLLRTEDGGRSWTRVPPETLPAALPGEGGFAASGTCLSASPEGRISIATGNGSRPRLVTSHDRGSTWTVQDLPLVSAEAAGATSVEMGPDGFGFVAGGAIGLPFAGARVSVSRDAGTTWTAAGEPALIGPIYGAARANGAGGHLMAAAGPGGISWSPDGGATWRVADTRSHWAVAFTDDGTGWAVGPRGTVTRLDFEHPEVRQGDLVVVGGRLFSGMEDEAISNPGVLIRDGVILAMGFDDRNVPEGAEVVRVADHATVLSGFFDLHAHYALDLFGEGRLGRVDEAKVNAAVFLANGVTSTFPAGEVTPTAFDEAVAAIASGERPGPRIHRSGAYFGSWRAGWDHGAMTSDSIRAEVRYWAGRGVRGFKAKGIRPAQLEVLIDEAHRFGLTVTGHLDSGFRDSVNPRDAIAMGIDRVEHFLGGDATPADRSAYASIERFDLDDPETRRLIDEQVGRFVDGGVFFDATLHTYGYYAERDPEVFPYFRDEMGILTPYARSVVEARLPMDPNEQFGRIYRVKHGTVRAFVEGGGAHLLTVGTDHPSWGEYFSGFALHRELHALSRADVPNHVVLRAATANAARALGLGHRLGTIEPGKLADLVVVDGDPLADITVTRKLLHVIRDGRVYDPAALLDSVRGTLGPVGPEEAAAWGAGLP